MDPASILIFLGVPGSGKGTQAKQVAEKFDLDHVSTGEILRNMVEDPNIDETTRNKIKADMTAGQLVDDQTIYKIVFSELEKHIVAKKGVVLDGAIRTLEQAKEYEKFFTEQGILDKVHVIEIRISDDVSRQRLLGRAAEKRGRRADDTPETIEKRITEQGNAKLQPLLDYYQENKHLITIDGERSIEEVHKDVIETIQAL